MKDLVIIPSVQSTVPLFFWISSLQCLNVVTGSETPRTSCFPEHPINMCSGGFCIKNSTKLINSSIGQKKVNPHKTCADLSDNITSAFTPCVLDKLLVAVDSCFWVSSQTNLFARLSWELHLLDSTFLMFAGQAALWLVRARYSLNV